VPDKKNVRGRGASSNNDARYLTTTREICDDGWGVDDDGPPALKTTVTVERAKTIISHNNSPDLPFDQTINPYRGCEHGCIYCYARPAHAYLDLSPGLDFESRLFSKPNAAQLLSKELARKNYRCSVISLGANTDAYQPIERKLCIRRSIIGVLAAHHHPVTIVSKSSLVERDIDLLAPMAALGLVQVFVSVTSLDRVLSRRMEPRAAAPERRLQTISNLAQAGIPTGVMFAPVIPALNDHHLEDVVEAAANHGARYAGFIMLRLPREVNGLFKEWLALHYPLRADHVLSRIRDIRQGRENDTQFGRRFKGTGPIAELVGQRFRRACARHELNQSPHTFETDLFCPPTKESDQLQLF
jgi:DNA repair photolyase